MSPSGKTDRPLCFKVMKGKCDQGTILSVSSSSETNECTSGSNRAFLQSDKDRTGDDRKPQQPKVKKDNPSQLRSK